MYERLIFSSCVENTNYIQCCFVCIYVLVLCNRVNSLNVIIAFYHGAVQGTDPGSITQ